MTPAPPPLDLVVIGGLTVDRFADGSSSPGGTVMHAARATAARGLGIGIVTAAGGEPEAQAGLAELRQIARFVECRPRDRSITFRHFVAADGRTLWLERAGGSAEVGPELRRRLDTRAVLCAPVLDEVPTAALEAWGDAVVRGATLQGWLRSAEVGAEVRPLALSAVGAGVVDALAGFDLLVASREDLAAEGQVPFDQLAALRRVFGTRPHLIVTDGADGLWHDAPLAASGSRHYPVPWRVETISTVGAGDILAAMLVTSFDHAQQRGEAWIAAAMRIVAEILEALSS